MPESLSLDAQSIYKLLHRLALDSIRATGGDPLKASHHVMLIPAELLFVELGIPKRTYYRRIKELHKAGLLASRAHKVSTRHQGEDLTRNDGTLFKVLLKPQMAQATRRVKLTYEELKQDYGRNLNADRASGRTAFKILNGQTNGARKNPVQDVAQSYTTQETKSKYYTHLLSFAIGKPSQTTLKHDCANGGGDGRNVVLERIFTIEGELVNSGPKEINKTIEDLARDFTRILGDNSFNFWCYLFHRMTRIYWTGRNFFPFLQGILLRAFTANQDRELRNSSAWVVSQLKSSGLWTDLNSV